MHFHNPLKMNDSSVTSALGFVVSVFFSIVGTILHSITMQNLCYGAGFISGTVSTYIALHNFFKKNKPR